MCAGSENRTEIITFSNSRSDAGGGCARGDPESICFKPVSHVPSVRIWGKPIEQAAEGFRIHQTLHLQGLCPRSEPATGVASCIILRRVRRICNRLGN